MGRLFFKSEEIRPIIDMAIEVFRNIASFHCLAEDMAIPVFYFKEEPWQDIETKELIIAYGGLRSSTKDFYYIGIKVKVFDGKFCFLVKSDGKIDDQIFCEETEPGDVSKKSLIKLLEDIYGVGSAS